MPSKLLTLCIIHQENKVLLGMKKRGFGQGKWNGFGGKVLENETIENAARREVREEAGIKIEELTKLGILEFEFWSPARRPPADVAGDTLQVHVFKATDFTGEPIEGEEMDPQWFRVSEIPFSSMWPDDIFWMPLFLENKKFKGRFVFEKSDTILEQELKETHEL